MRMWVNPLSWKRANSDNAKMSRKLFGFSSWYNTKLRQLIVAPIQGVSNRNYFKEFKAVLFYSSVHSDNLEKTVISNLWYHRVRSVAMERLNRTWNFFWLLRYSLGNNQSQENVSRNLSKLSVTLNLWSWRILKVAWLYAITLCESIWVEL